MLKKFMQILSLFLTIVLVANMLPLGVLAEEWNAEKEKIADVASTEAVSSAEDVQIVAELTNKRTEFSKQFQLSNGLNMAVLYSDAVHYEKDGNWEQIDNSLTAQEDGSYANTAGVWDVRFPQKLNGENSVVISKDGYTLSFSLEGELKRLNTGLQKAASEETVQAFSAQTATAEVIAADTGKLNRETAHMEAAVQRKDSRLRYEKVFEGTHIQYDLQSNTVKESIVLEAYDANLTGYRYRLDVGQLRPVLQESGQIDFYDKDGKTVVMTMPAPFMEDAAGEYCDDVQVQLTGKGSSYTLTYTLSRSWLGAKDRAWPVIVDPVVSADLSRSNIEDRTVSQKNDQGEGWGMNACGYSAKYGVHRFYLQYLELPELTSSDVIISATVANYKAFASSTTTPVEVHKVTEAWRSANISWANKPEFNTTIEDYAIVKEIDWYDWDVTDIVREWYVSGNTGMMFKASDAIENGGTDSFKQFLSENYGVAESRPQLYIVYRNNNGLEGYWDYASASAGRAGTGYVNSYTGNLVWTRSDMGFGGNRMPVSITHVYNLGEHTTNAFGMGYGWRTNFNQRISSTTIDSKKYYIWEDADGTRHYFKNKSYGVFEDEDGLELTLRSVSVAANTGVTGGVYSITDKTGNVSVFDTKGRMIRQINNQATKSSIAITYTTTTSMCIDKITDGVGRVYDFSYTDGNLSGIDYYGTAEIPKSYMTFGYDTLGNLTTVTDADGEESTYIYNDAHVLMTAQDVDGYQLQYAYYVPTSDHQPYRVRQVKESHGTTQGGELNIEYSHNQTTFTDHNGQVEILQFNNLGNTVSVQDDEGHAQYAQYAINDSGETGKANQLRLSSKMQNTVANLLTDTGFENGTVWGPSGVYSPEEVNAISTLHAYEGSKSLCVISNNDALSEPVTIPAGETYTFSAYVKTEDCRVTLSLGDATSAELPANSDWTRLEVSFTNPYEEALGYRACVQLTMGDTGNAYVDCVQLEKAASASRYNMVQNGDFRGTDGWNNSTGRTTVQTPGAPQLSTDVYQITGDATQQKRITQSVNVSGVEGDNFVLTGWAKGDSAPLPEAEEGENQRRFALIGTFHYTDGTTKEFVASFNPDTNAEQSWQYTAQVMVAEKAYSSVTVAIAYDYNVNTVYFDGIQLYREQFGSSYTYDEDGNVISVVDLQKQKTEYEYTDNDLTKAILPTGAELTYTYDDYHNVKTATTEEGLVYSFVYDTYGNNTSVSVTDNTTTVTSSATYTADGNRMVTATNSLGKVTTYEYDPDTNVLNWVKYPNDTDDTKTVYTYDEMYRAATIAATTDTELDMSVEYTYTDDYLTKVETPTTAYDFTYGNFGLRTSVKIGSRTLASYRYTDDRNFYLAGLDYGNGDKVEYTYDEKGRLICQTYEDGDTVTYQYDNDGALAAMTDSATGRTTRYFYDTTGRTMKYTETGTDYSHSVAYSYDTSNNLTTQTEIINGVTHTTSYTYDTDNRVTSKTTDGITVEYTYDTLGRITQQVTKNGETTVKTETYTFTPNSTQVATYRTQIGSYDVTYSYTYDDNGNILTINDGTNETSYAYDSQNQLIRENNQSSNYTRTWTYDNAGNILNRKQYAYTTEEPGSANSTYSYTYGVEEWGDLLTGYRGTNITYDEIGNPLSYLGMQFTWEHGRQLASVQTAGFTGTYSYDSDGMRVGRTSGSNTYKYIYSGSQLVRMEYNSNVLEFTYDAQGTPISVTLNGTQYFYVTNLQGDVVRIVSDTGAVQAQYIYDAWGICATMSSKPIGQLNPLRYRGYVYDVETSLYYLQSRYYDPYTGRFLNADVFIGTGQGFTGNNMFAYCNNNPVIFCDHTGEAPEFPPLIQGGLNLPPEGGIPVVIDGVTYYYAIGFKDGYLSEYWFDTEGNLVRARHHSDHRTPWEHDNPHDHKGKKDDKGNNTIQNGPLPVDEKFKAPKDIKETIQSLVNPTKTSAWDSIKKAFNYTAATVTIYAAAKWGIAILLAASTGGSSLAIAAATP